MLRLSLILVLLLTAFVIELYAQPLLVNDFQKQVVSSNISSMPLEFTENRGQWDEKALYKAEAGGATFWFCIDEVVYQFTRNTGGLEESQLPQRPDIPGMPDKFNHPRYKKESMVLKAQFIGADFNPEIVGEDRLSHNNNYFIGNIPSQWATDVPNYSSVTYKNIYPDIDLTYHGDDKGMKYDFIINPGADISQIRIKYEGVNGLDVTSNGDLKADSKFGPVYERIPQIYQEIDGQKRGIQGHYIMLESGIFGFALEDGFNPAYPVVIDPELVYSTYLGGSGGDIGFDIAVDSSGNAFMTGENFSGDFPMVDPYDGSYNGGNYDAIISKLSTTGDSLLYSTYLGGSDSDVGLNIAADHSGCAYVVGFTGSTNFPTVDPYDSSYNGGQDVFITKLSPSGNSLIFSTYLGGSGWERPYGLDVDNSGNIYMTGGTSSGDFPTFNPYDGSYNGGLNNHTDAFVTKLSPTGIFLVYSTYLGGSEDDEGYDVAIDNSGNAYVIGTTRSTNFPTLNPIQTYQGQANYSDAFVTKLSPSGNSLIYSTYLGGNAHDEGIAIAIDDSGNAYVAGNTSSLNFPTLNPYDGSYNGGGDIFLTKLSSIGNSVLYSTYLGGGNQELCEGIAVDYSRKGYVTGITLSVDFPTVSPYDASYNGDYDIFLTKFSLTGNSLSYSTFMGGSGMDVVNGYVMNDSENAYMVGYTRSANFPMVNPYDNNLSGNCDVFVANFARLNSNKIIAGAGPNGIISPSGNVIVNDGADTTFTITPNIGYSVRDVLVDSSSIGPQMTYTFENVTTNHSIAANFERSLRSLWHVSTSGNDTTGNGSEGNPFRTIQHGVSAAINGDTVLVEEGVYYGNINFNGHSIVLASYYLLDQDSSHISSTVIDGQHSGSVIAIQTGEDSTTQIIGLTIQNGDSLINGSGIYLSGSSPAISNCQIRGTIFGRGALTISSCSVEDSIYINHGEGAGNLSINRSTLHGSIGMSYLLYGSTLNITESKLYSIHINWYWSMNLLNDSLFDCSVYTVNSITNIRNCAFIQSLLSNGSDVALNVDSSFIGEGYFGGQMTYESTFRNCVIKDGIHTRGELTVENSTIQGGITKLEHYPLTINNTIITTLGSPSVISSPDIMHVSCCNFYGFSGNNWLSGTPATVDTSSVFFNDPQFCDTTNQNFTLRNNSPCLPENNSCGQLIGALRQGCTYTSHILYVATTGNDTTGNGSVTNPFRTIQRAINSSFDKDTVLVSDGHYYERINFLGKSITVASQQLLDNDSLHFQNTIIDGDTLVLGFADTASVVRFVSSEDSTSILYGFTIQKGVGTFSNGGGIYCDNISSPTISHCNIFQNQNYGIYCHQRDVPIIRNCDISSNLIGGIMAQGASLSYIYTIILDSCSIFNNSGPGFYGAFRRSAKFINCNISNNQGDGIRAVQSRIYDSNISDNVGSGIINATYGVKDIQLDNFDHFSDSISNCSIERNGGYGIMIGGAGAGYISNCTIKYNNYGIYGSYDAIFEVHDTEISHNVNGIYSYAPDLAVDVENCIFKHNTNNAIRSQSLIANGCLFIDNSGTSGGAISLRSPRGSNIQGCSFVANSAYSGSGIICSSSYGYGAPTILRNNIFAYNQNGSAISWADSSSSLSISCTDIFGNPGGDWTGCIAGQADTNGNFSADPRFCDTTAGDFHLAANSQCLPANNTCGVLVGALGVGCNAITRTICVAITGNDTTGNGTLATPYKTIQHGINMSVNGDTVLVSDGHYYERINFRGKAIILSSLHLLDNDSLHIANTMIDGDTLALGVADTGSIVCFVNNEDSSSVLRGFTLRGGIGTIDNSVRAGGGIYCKGDSISPVISNCTLIGNSADSGSDFYYNASSSYAKTVNLLNCVLASSQGYSPWLSSGNIQITNCQILGKLFARKITLNMSSCSIGDSLRFGQGNGVVDINNSYLYGSISYIYPGSSHYVLTITNSKIYGSHITWNWYMNYSNDSLFNCSVYVYNSSLNIRNCAFIQSPISGAADVFLDVDSSFIGAGYVNGSNSSMAIFRNSIIKNGINGYYLTVENSTLEGSGIFSFGSNLLLNKTIISTHGSPAVISGSDNLHVSCCNFYGFNGNSWLSGNPVNPDTSNIFIADPQFCDTSNGNYTLRSNSPCLPENNSCGQLIGALDQGCIGYYNITASTGPNGTITPFGVVNLNYGADTTFAIIPDNGYHVADVVVDDSTIGSVFSYRFINITTNHTISASFAINNYTITATASPNGSIAPAGEISVNYGGNQTFSIVPDTGYHVIDVLIDSVSIGPVAEYSFSNITVNHSINASFAINTYTITANAGQNGTISPLGVININYGQDTTFAITPNIGYHVSDVLVDGNLVGPVSSYTFTDVVSNHSISAGFEINTFMIIATAGEGGTIYPSGVVIVNFGSDTTFTITPNPNYHVANVLVDGASVGDTTSYAFNDVTNGHVIAANFTGDCAYVVGDANNSHTFTGLDVTYSVRYFKGNNPPPYSCECPPHGVWYVAGDVNGSCSFSGLDVTYMVRYFKGGAAPIPCPDCPPPFVK
jgi:hypothetical protein